MSADLEEYGEEKFWFSRDESGVTIGVTGAAIASLGSLQGIDFAEVGDEFNTGDWIAEITGSEGGLEVRAPMALVIEELNGELTNEPSRLEDDPTGDGWLLRGKPLA